MMTGQKSSAKPLISIIVPIHNSEAFLEQCLLSLQQQTLPDLEFILIDDRSTDGSDRICRRFITRDPRFHLIRGQGHGPGAARNLGLNAAGGRYIGFVDSDDWIEPDMMAKMLDAIFNRQSQVCLCNFIREFPDRSRPVILDQSGILAPQEVEALILDLIGPEDIAGPPTVIMGSVWRCLIQRDFLEENSICFDPDVRLMEDLIFMLRVMVRKPSVCVAPGIFYHYRIHQDSLAHRRRKDLYSIKQDVYERVREILSSQGMAELADRRLKTRYILLCLSALEALGLESALIDGDHQASDREEEMDSADEARICRIIEDPQLQRNLNQLDLQSLPDWERAMVSAITTKDRLQVIQLFAGTAPRFDSMHRRAERNAGK